jgi:multimeric flavodoxin WrbA
MERREMIGAASAAVAVTAIRASASAQAVAAKRKIVGISCSPRKGKTTTAAVQLCLDAAKERDPSLEIELIDLADLSIPAYLAAGVPLKPGDKDDFPKLAEKLGDPAVVGIVVGSPVYFANMTALCKAFLDRCIEFRKAGFKLSNKVAGALAVGSARNGGQELTVRSIQSALMCQDMIVVGDGQPSARIGATLWNRNDSIAEDEFGVSTAENLGRRVAQVAARLHP